MHALLAAALALAAAGAPPVRQESAPRGGKIRWSVDPDATLAQAKREGLPQVWYFTDDACPADLRLDAGALSDDAVVRQAGAFARVMLNCTRPTAAQRELMRKHGVDAFPTLLLLEPDGRLIEKVRGEKHARELVAILRGASAPYDPAQRLARSLAELGDVRSWLEGRSAMLGSDDPGVRERAAADLKRLKTALDDALLAAARSDDPDLRARLRELLGPPGENPPK